MTSLDADIHDYEVRKFILRLINFFGQTTIEKCLANYQKSLLSSGPVFREYYLKTRHPWWESLEYFFELERKGKSIKKNLDPKLKRLAADGKTLSILQQNMPEK